MIVQYSVNKQINSRAELMTYLVTIPKCNIARFFAIVDSQTSFTLC